MTTSEVAVTLIRADNAVTTTAAEPTPLTHAPDRAARAPERTPKMTVNAAKPSGASEKAKDAASCEIPAAMTASGNVICSGTRLPACHTAAVVGQKPDQSAAGPNPNTHSAVRGAAITVSPPATWMSASSALSRATMRRCMASSTLPAPPATPVQARPDNTPERMVTRPRSAPLAARVSTSFRSVVRIAR